MEPLVSILIPAHNAEAWIVETLRSALAQTWTNKELIVVDDGSTDGTLFIARRFESSSVKVVSQPNQGASAARNSALQLAQGDYIQWLDADDLLAPDKIEKQLAAIARVSPTTLLSSAWGYFYHRPWKAKVKATALWEDLGPAEWLRRKMEHNLHMANFSWLVSRQLTDAAGPWDIRLSLDDDGEYFCRVLCNSDAIKFVGQAKGFYRRSSPFSQSHVTENKLESQLRSAKMQIETALKFYDSPELRQACLDYLQRWLIYWFPERPDLVQQTHDLAAWLGGELHQPQLRRKYRFLSKVIGFHWAKRVERTYNSGKWRLVAAYDRLISACSSQAAD